MAAVPPCTLPISGEGRQRARARGENLLITKASYGLQLLKHPHLRQPAATRMAHTAWLMAAPPTRSQQLAASDFVMSSSHCDIDEKLMDALGAVAPPQLSSAPAAARQGRVRAALCVGTAEWPVQHPRC